MITVELDLRPQASQRPHLLTLLGWISRWACGHCLAACLAAFLPAFLAAFLATSLAAEQPLDHNALYDPRQLRDIQLVMPEKDWDALRSQTRAMPLALRKPALPSPFTYFQADLIVDGRRIDSVGVRKKGFVGSLDQEFPSLKIKFDEFLDQSPISGIDNLTLNNNKQDKTLVSQYLAYRFFAAAELPAPRCTFARVTVNDKYLGIYSNVESIRKPFLQRQFGSTKGKLYEGTLADFLPGRVEDFEAKSKRAEARGELESLAQLLANSESLDLDELNRHIDIEQFIRFWAVESLINCWDGYTSNQNNYFLYHSPLDNRFHFLPWGADATFVRQELVRSRRESIHLGAVLAHRLYQQEAMQRRYLEVMTNLLENVWDEHELLGVIDDLEGLLQDHLHPRQDGFTKALDQTRSFVKTRAREIRDDMEQWPVPMPDAAREPMYTRSVGRVTGSFSTTWATKPPDDPYGFGEAQLEMVLDDGDRVKFSELGVYGQHVTDQEGHPARHLVFIGKRESNGIRVKLLVGLSETRYLSASPDRPVVVQGNLEEGGFGLFGVLSTHGVRLVGGTMTVSAAPTSDGDRVRGQIDVDVLRMEKSP